MHYWSPRLGIVLTCALVTLSGNAGTSYATPNLAKVGLFTEFSVPTPESEPYAVAAGPDGNVWFTEQMSGKIGRLTPSGAVTEFPVVNYGLVDIAAGPDGNVWFTETDAVVGRITPDGTVTRFSIPTSTGYPQGISLGPDANLWFTEVLGDKIGRITTEGTVTEFPVPTAGADPYNIAAGSDGNLWFTEFGDNPKIGRITPAGDITEFPVPSTENQVEGIAAGADGNIWFTELGHHGADPKIGRITPAGDVTEFAVPSTQSRPVAIAAGPDGNLWFTEDGHLHEGNNIARITPTGTITEFPIPTRHACPCSITAGPDGNMWFTEIQANANKIGRITDLPLREATLTPNSGPPSTVVHVDGTGWGTFESVTIGFNDAGKGRSVLARATTDVAGHFSVEVTVPPNATVGPQSIRMEGHISGLSRRTSFTVT